MDYTNLENYLSKRISKINDEIQRINEAKENKERIDGFVFMLSSYGDIDREELDYIMSLFYLEENKRIETIEKLNEALIILSLIGTSSEEIFRPQLEKAKLFIDSLVEQLKRYSASIEIGYYKKDIIAKSSLEEYKNYLSYFDGGKIVRYPELDELKKFFAFLKDTNIDIEERNMVIKEFGKSCLDYYESKRKIIEEVEKKRNSRKKIKRVEERAAETRREIQQSQESNPIVYVEESEVILSEEEKVIVDRIKTLITDLESDIQVVEHDGAVDLLRNDFNMENHIRFYELSSNVWSLVLEDLKLNLLPSINTNKDEVLKLFKYIINKYDNEYMRQQEQVAQEEIFISRIEEFNEKELVEIKTLVRRAQRCIESLSDGDKNSIENINKSLNNGDFDIAGNISPKFTFSDVKLISLYKNLIEHYDSYIALREFEPNSSDILGDVEKDIMTQMTEVRQAVRNLNEFLEEQKKTDELTLDEPYTYSNQKRNLIIFLSNSETGRYYASESQTEAIKSKQVDTTNVKSIPGIFGKLLFIDFQELKKNQNTKKNTGKYEKILKAHRLRKGTSRLAYIQMSISPENKSLLRQQFQMTDNPEVLLVVNADFKTTSSNDVYDKFNSNMGAEINQIRNLNTVLMQRMNAETFAHICGMIQDGLDIYEKLEKNPYKPLVPGPDGREPGGDN